MLGPSANEKCGLGADVRENGLETQRVFQRLACFSHHVLPPSGGEKSGLRSSSDYTPRQFILRSNEETNDDPQHSLFTITFYYHCSPRSYLQAVRTASGWPGWPSPTPT